jgi:hypothetical protein
MRRRNLQFQQEQAGHMLTSWGRGEVALIAGIYGKREGVPAIPSRPHRERNG